MTGWLQILSLLALLWPAVMTLDGVDYGTPSLKRGLTEEEKQMFVRLHNKYRELTAKGLFYNKPQAANMKKMVWNETIAEYAQKWSDKCGGPGHGGNPGQGQNGAFSNPPSLIFRTAFLGWNDAEAHRWNWNLSDPESAKTWFKSGAGHFSQVIWAKSSSVGCGYTTCKSHLSRLYCHYWPMGNNEKTVYKPGKPCSQCYPGATCEDGALCVGGAPTKPPPPVCNNNYSNCKSLKPYCALGKVQRGCRVTCNKCFRNVQECKDQYWNCKHLAPYCRYRQPKLERGCPVTCNTCEKVGKIVDELIKQGEDNNVSA